MKNLIFCFFFTVIPYFFSARIQLSTTLTSDLSLCLIWSLSRQSSSNSLYCSSTTTTTTTQFSRWPCKKICISICDDEKSLNHSLSRYLSRSKSKWRWWHKTKKNPISKNFTTSLLIIYTTTTTTFPWFILTTILPSPNIFFTF